MGRQIKTRSVESPPRFFRFTAEDAPTDKPQQQVQLHLDEYEALRLSDNLGYDHGEASRIMDISRPTFTRLLNRARAKMARFLTDGGELEITGGEVLFAADVYCCRICFRPFRWTGSGAPVCPRCRSDEVLKARASCHHDCRCCEEAAEEE